MSEVTLTVSADGAAGAAATPAPEVAHWVRAAARDVNARGKVRYRWYRMVYREGQWRYFAEEREPKGMFLASERHWSSGGYVYTGELVAQHEYGRSIDTVYEVTPDGKLEEVPFRAVRQGLAITRRDGTEVILPDPRRRS